MENHMHSQKQYKKEGHLDNGPHWTYSYSMYHWQIHMVHFAYVILNIVRDHNLTIF